MGLGDMVLRIATGIVSIALILMVVWVMSNFYLKGTVKSPQAAAIAAASPTQTPVARPPMFEPPDRMANIRSVMRQVTLHTTLPSRPRFEMTTYTVQKGDTLVVLESMKMEHALIARIEGVVAEVLCMAGEQVMAGRLLIRITTTEAVEREGTS